MKKLEFSNQQKPKFKDPSSSIAASVLMQAAVWFDVMDLVCWTITLCWSGSVCLKWLWSTFKL